MSIIFLVGKVHVAWRFLRNDCVTLLDLRTKVPSLGTNQPCYWPVKGPITWSPELQRGEQETGLQCPLGRTHDKPEATTRGQSLSECWAQIRQETGNSALQMVALVDGGKEQSLVMGSGGGATKWYRGGGDKWSFTSTKKRGVEKVLAMLKGGGGTTSFGVILTSEFAVLVIQKVGGQKGSTLWKGKTTGLTLCWGGGGTNKFKPAIFPFCSPPSSLPVVNDQSLREAG